MWSIKWAEKAHCDPYREQDFRTENTLIPCSTYWTFYLAKSKFTQRKVNKFELCHQDTWWRPETKLREASRNARVLQGIRLRMSPWSTKLREKLITWLPAPEFPLFIGCPVLLRPSHTDSSRKSKGFKLKWKKILWTTPMTGICMCRENEIKK